MSLIQAFQQLRQLVFFDIETVSEVQHWEQLSEAAQAQWARKARRAAPDLSPDEAYPARAAIFAEFGKVVVISIGFFHLEEAENQEPTLTFRVKSLANHDERKLLHDFKSLITKKFDQKHLRLVAHNGFEFDIPYLCRRMLIHGISLPWALDLSGRKPWENPHIDTLELWKFGDRKHYTPLELLTHIFGIPSPKEDIDGSQVGSVYYGEEDGLERISRYCQNDVIATAQVYLKLQCLPTLPESQIYRVGE